MAFGQQSFQQPPSMGGDGQYKIPITQIIQSILFFKAQAIAMANHDGSKGLTRFLNKVTSPYHDKELAIDEARIGNMLEAVKMNRSGKGSTIAEAEHWADEEIIAATMRMLGRNNLLSRGEEQMEF